MSRYRPPVPTVGRCPVCGKIRYETHAIARKARRHSHLRGQTVYRCGDFYHFGTPARAETATGGRECRVPHKPHHRTVTEAETAADDAVRMGRPRPVVFRCPCGGGFCTARPRKPRPPTVTARRQAA
jgi:hypothetical protein